jgi:hypothetical protein
MLKQQNATLVIKHKGARSDGEACLSHTHYSAAHWPGQVTKDRAKKTGKHARSITRDAVNQIDGLYGCR